MFLDFLFVFLPPATGGNDSPRFPRKKTLSVKTAMSDSIFQDTKALRVFLGSRVDGSGFVRLAGIRSLAAYSGLSEREVMLNLLEAGYWPERFRRSRSVLAGHELQRLLCSRVLVVGCGGLGGHVATLLVRSGVGSLRLCDPDVFDESNLNRQMFCTESTLGRAKAEVCRERLLDIASYAGIEAHIMEAGPENLPWLMAGMDAVVDGLDSVPKKIMLEEETAKVGLPFVHGSVCREEGFAFRAGAGLCRLAGMYGSPAGQSREQHSDQDAPPDTVSVSAAGVACLMASLLLRSLISDTDWNSPLLHLDCSIPELERFAF